MLIYLDITHSYYEEILLNQMITFCDQFFSEKFGDFTLDKPFFYRKFTFSINVTANNQLTEFVVKSIIRVDKNGQNSNEEWEKYSFRKSLATYSLFDQLHITSFPKMLAYNTDLYLILMNKINGTSLDSFLLNDSQGDIEQYLLMYSESLATLHCLTASKEIFSRYINLLQEFGISERKHEINWVRGSSKSVLKLQKLLTANGYYLPDNFFNALFDAFQTAETSEFLSIIHSDPCPDNIILNDQGLFFIDVVTIDYYYSFIDVAYFEIFFPSCWCAGLIPPHLQDKMRTKYITTYQKYRTIDPETYARHAFIGSVLFETINLIMYLEEYNARKMIETNTTWGIDNIHNRITTRYELIQQYGSKLSNFEPIVQGFRQLLKLIEIKYGKTEGLKFYPVFASPDLNDKESH